MTERWKMDRFNQYAADYLYLDQARYEAIYQELLDDGYSEEEAEVLALEILGDEI